MGLLGHKVDSIDYWRAKSQAMTPELEKERIRTRRESEQDAAFVVFIDRRAATEASQVRRIIHLKSILTSGNAIHSWPSFLLGIYWSV